MVNGFFMSKCYEIVSVFRRHSRFYLTKLSKLGEMYAAENLQLIC